jgi:hypothetical protein
METVMPVRTALWRVGAEPKRLQEAKLTNERTLEEMIVAAPAILSDEWMLIGRQEDTGTGGRIDLLAIAPDGSLVLIELKRDRTPRDVVAQALDYASWVERLRPQEITAIYSRFAPGRSLQDDFRSKFGEALDEEQLNQSHQIIIVAAGLDDSTERITAYLSDRDIPINVLCFQAFTIGENQLLSRAWLLDPIRLQTSLGGSQDGPSEPWNGEFYSSFGDGEGRKWIDAVKYGFISGGGGTWYSRTLHLLSPGDRVWVRVPKAGFVGVGKAIGHVQPASTFRVLTEKGEASILEAETSGTYSRELDDPDRCEYFVPVRWLQVVPIEKAINGLELFGNQNTVCKPTAQKWRSTIEQLKQAFPDFNK